MHSSNSEAPTRLVVFLGQRTSDDVPDAVPSGQYDPTGHLFCAFHVDIYDNERRSASTHHIYNHGKHVSVKKHKLFESGRAVEFYSP